MALSPPEPLSSLHDLTRFRSGEDSLDDWLRRRALANQVSGATRTLVFCDGNELTGFYALAAGAVAAIDAPGRLRRNMPDPIPVVVLARLAVSVPRQGEGIGRSLLYDAVSRITAASELIGIRGVLVRAVSEEVLGFYRACGFEPSRFDALTLMATLADLKAA